MPIPFNCPHCGLDTLVDDEFAGQSGPCAGCGKTVSIPYQVAASTPDTTTAGRRTSPGTIAAIVVISILSASVVFAVLAILVFPSFHVVQDTLHKTTCKSNLQRIAEAIRQYEIEHGSLPPAYVADANGKPMHSWRVLILPQLGETGLYNRYSFNEPWNGPNNSDLVRQMPDVFACPADPDAIAKGETNYMALVGPKTLFPGATPVRTADMRDDRTTTLLVAETPVSGAVWLEPKDLNVTRMQFNINTGANGEIGGHHTRGAHAITADGEVHFLGELTATDYLQGMTTHSGDEDIPWDVLDN